MIQLATRSGFSLFVNANRLHMLGVRFPPVTVGRSEWATLVHGDARVKAKRKPRQKNGL